MAKLGRPPIPKNQRKAKFLSLRLTAAERREIEKSAAKDSAPTTQWARAVLLAHPQPNPESIMTTLKLNESELEILYRQDPSKRNKGGWQRLLVTLQELTNQTTGEITLPPIIRERIPRYAFDYNEGGWEDRLKGIFERTLGPRLDGNV